MKTLPLITATALLTILLLVGFAAFYKAASLTYYLLAIYFLLRSPNARH